MFRFADLNRVVWPVEIGDATLRAVFNIYTRKELRARKRRATEALVARLGDDGQPKTPDDLIALLEVATDKEDDDEAQLHARVIGWYDVEDEEGKPLAFSTERLQALLDTDAGFKAFNRGLLEASQAGPSKNSLPGPAGLPARDQA